MADELKRNRGQVDGGYRRKTVTIPESLADRVDAEMKSSKGRETFSSIVTDAVEKRYVRRRER